MQPVFWRIYQSIRYTFEWLEEHKIITDLKRRSGVLNQDYITTYYDIAFTWHEHMKNEIFQTIHTCDEKTQVYMFEELIPYLSDWRIKSVPYDYINRIVEDYNTKEEFRFNEEVKKKDEEHRAKVDYSKPHMEIIKPDQPSKKIGLLGGLSNYILLPKENNYFYEYWGIPELINTDVLPEYYADIEALQKNFIDSTSLYTKLYQQGKYVPSDRITILKNVLQKESKENKKELPESPEEKLLPSPIRKIPTNLTIKQLLYLFKSLIDGNIITELEPIKDMHEAICKVFSSTRAEDLKVDKLQKEWSEIRKDPKIARFWQDKFIELEKIAKKDNPNNIR